MKLVTSDSLQSITLATLHFVHSIRRFTNHALATLQFLQQNGAFKAYFPLIRLILLHFLQRSLAN
ncbi:hypothetical protein FHS16_003447 [Paenibacillus endophyticus]|uniref:Uncharacterized protein n=1 Tax=Paenibacillus endophyticus TaxID=1294268 RepID=A0A7W5GB38_9BACL|nr:hypothetical protein [Paenibacillus endophyticus]